MDQVVVLQNTWLNPKESDEVPVFSFASPGYELGLWVDIEGGGIFIIRTCGSHPYSVALHTGYKHVHLKKFLS